MDTVQQFARKVADQIKGYLPLEYQDVECEIEKVQKNNGVYLTGVCLKRPEEQVGVNVYMEEYLEAYQKDWTWNEVMKDIASAVTVALKDKHLIPSDKIGDYEAVKCYLEPVLINTKTNRQMLQDMPHMRIEDLAVICQLQFPLREGTGSVRVTDSILEHWGVRKGQLFDQTFENMRMPGKYVLQDMNKCLEAILGEEVLQTNLLNATDELLCKRAPDCSQKADMYVLSNTNHVNGAAALLCSDVMEKVNRLFPDGYYILPASVHECIILPKTDDIDPKGLREMVYEINQTQVRKEEVLSNNIYEYDKERGKIRIVPDSLEKGKETER